jgi:hypothetical protein
MRADYNLQTCLAAGRRLAAACVAAAASGVTREEAEKSEETSRVATGTRIRIRTSIHLAYLCWAKMLNTWGGAHRLHGPWTAAPLALPQGRACSHNHFSGEDARTEWELCSWWKMNVSLPSIMTCYMILKTLWTIEGYDFPLISSTNQIKGWNYIFCPF